VRLAAANLRLCLTGHPEQNGSYELLNLSCIPTDVAAEPHVHYLCKWDNISGITELLEGGRKYFCCLMPTSKIGTPVFRQG
jgi:hypothetical protein